MKRLQQVWLDFTGGMDVGVLSGLLKTDGGITNEFDLKQACFNKVLSVQKDLLMPCRELLLS
jgi:hypothetical protein